MTKTGEIHDHERDDEHDHEEDDDDAGDAAARARARWARWAETRRDGDRGARPRSHRRSGGRMERAGGEKAAMEAITKNPDQPYTGEETLGKDRYFTAVYADRAVSEACVGCHNKHEESPRHDFKLGDVLGGIVIRVAI